MAWPVSDPVAKRSATLCGCPFRVVRVLAWLPYRIGYSDVMNGLAPTKVRAVAPSLALRDEVCAAPDITGESIRVLGG
jgi:hypothetical protein